MRKVPLQPFGVALESEGGHLADVAPETLRALLEEHRLVLLRGFLPEERDAFLAYCRSVPSAKTVDWAFGPVLELKEQPDAKNYLFSAEAVPFHWDGAFHVEPDALCFHCVEAPEASEGGETLFADGGSVWRNASQAEQERLRAVQLEYETEKVAHYGGTFRSPLVVTHPKTGESIVRFAEKVETSKNPVRLRVSGVPEVEGETIARTIAARLYEPEVQYAHRWQQGDYLFADNFALVHGRKAFQSGASRHLRRVQLRFDAWRE